MRFLLRPTWLLTVCPIVALAQSPQAPSVILTATENGLESQTEFYCYGKIHAYIRLAESMVGPHTLEGIWTGPDGKVKDRSTASLNFSSPGESTAYLWLAFDAPNLLGGLNPGRDQEKASDNGAWQLDARWDHQPLLKKTFVVHCG